MDHQTSHARHSPAPGSRGAASATRSHWADGGATEAMARCAPETTCRVRAGSAINASRDGAASAGEVRHLDLNPLSVAGTALHVEVQVEWRRKDHASLCGGRSAG